MPEGPWGNRFISADPRLTSPIPWRLASPPDECKELTNCTHPSKTPTKHVQTTYHPAVPLLRRGPAEAPTQPHHSSHSISITEARVLQQRYAPPDCGCLPSFPTRPRTPRCGRHPEQHWHSAFGPSLSPRKTRTVGWPVDVVAVDVSLLRVPCCSARNVSREALTWHSVEG